MSEDLDLPEGSVERDRWLDRLLTELLELAGPDRSARLEERCRGDESLAAEARELLTSAERAEESTSEGLQPLSHLQALAAAPPDSLGPYRVLREIGRGGMGVVYLGQRADGAYEQQVAIKVLDSVAKERSAGRFLQERQILAELDHPGIARLLDGGTTEDGRPYFVMEYVEGRSIVVYAADESLGLEQRLRLLVELCEAVDAAHRSLVVHRDIKPSNVLVDEDGRVRLLDFGIARTLDETASATETGHRALTPQYATPEQYQGRAATVASDVYQLGLVAYELVAQRRPYDVSTTTLEESVRLVCQVAPPPPSVVASDGAFNVPRDLDLIVMKALHKEPERRYATAAALAADVRRLLRSEPVAARPDSFAYRAKLFCRRNAVAVSAVGTAVLLLVGSTTWFLVRLANEQRATAAQARDAEQQRDRAEQVLSFLIDSFATADPLYSPDPEMSARDLLDRAATRLSEDGSTLPLDRARLLVVVAKLEARLGLAEQSRQRLEKALEIQRAAQAQDPEVLLDAQNNRASALLNQGRFDEAKELLEATATLAAESGRLELQRDHALALADAEQSLGNFDEAEALYREAIDFSREHGLAHDVLLRGLGDLLLIRGRPQEAIGVLEEALEVTIEERGPDHGALYGLHTSLGNSLVEMGRAAESVPHQRRALELLVQRVGDKDRRVITVSNNLGIALNASDQSDQAVPVLRGALELAQELGVGEANLMLTLGGVLHAVEPGSREGEQLLRRSRALMEEERGPEFWFLGILDDNLGEVLLAQGRLDEAETVLRRSLDIAALNGRRDQVGSAHPLAALAQIAEARGDVEEARALLTEALALRVEALGPDAELTRQVEQRLAQLPS